MGDTEDGRQGLTEDQLVDDAVMDTLIRESVCQTIGDNPFSQARVHQWTSNMTNGCLKRLAALNKPFKYVCHFTLGQRVRLHATSMRSITSICAYACFHCLDSSTRLILEQAGAGLQAASTVRWNDKTDGKMSVMWESQTVLVLATVFWLAV